MGSARSLASCYDHVEVMGRLTDSTNSNHEVQRRRCLGMLFSQDRRAGGVGSCFFLFPSFILPVLVVLGFQLDWTGFALLHACARLHPFPCTFSSSLASLAGGLLLLTPAPAELAFIPLCAVWKIDRP